MSLAQGGAAKVVVVMPAYNAGRTLRLTYEELPEESVNLVILVDDGSTDATLDIARELGLEIFVHDRNYGYGANQKTCYTEALRAGADIVVMVHPDYQYDPTLVPQIIEPITLGHADLVLGSRLKSGRGGTEGDAVVEVPGQPLPHLGGEPRLRPRDVRVPHGVPRFQSRSPGGGELPDELRRLRVRPGDRVADGGRRLPAGGDRRPVRYFPDASTASFFDSCVYGTKILWVVTRYLLHRSGLKRSRRLESIRRRYTRLGPGAEGAGPH